MHELEQKRFLTSSDLELQDMRDTPAGFFTALTMQGVADETLIVGKGETRFRIVLQPGNWQFNAYELIGKDMFEKPGFLMPAGMLSIEGERSSAYDATRLSPIPGDIVLSDGAWFIAASETTGFRDTFFLGLWAGDRIDGSASRIGFKAWRMTIGEGVDRRVVCERQAPANAN